MRGYSQDLRERIIEALQSGESTKAVAKRFKISRWTVNRYRNREALGQLAETTRKGPSFRLSEEGFIRLEKQVKMHPDWTLEQHAKALTQSEGVSFKKSVIGKYLKLMGITIKKDVLSPRTG